MNYCDMDKLIKLEAVRGIPKVKVDHDGVYGACAMGKQTRAHHNAVKTIMNKRCLELVHIDLMGPT